MRAVYFFLFVLSLTFIGCRSDENEVQVGDAQVMDAAAGIDAGKRDKGIPDIKHDTFSKAKSCVSSWKDALDNGFGRIDGTIIAVVTPSDKHCELYNDDHLILEMKVNGGNYRMVINIGDLNPQTGQEMRFADFPHALPAPAWSEGQHLGVELDYPTTLGAHRADFQPLSFNNMIQEVSNRLVLGAKVSVYGTVGDINIFHGAHLIHRGTTSARNQDGAIVINPDSANPRFLLFHFYSQIF